MSKVIVLELGPGSHRIIGDYHNCTASQLETCFQEVGGRSSTPQLATSDGSLPPFISHFQFVLIYFHIEDR